MSPVTPLPLYPCLCSHHIQISRTEPEASSSLAGLSPCSGWPSLRGSVQGSTQSRFVGHATDDRLSADSCQDLKVAGYVVTFPPKLSSAVAGSMVAEVAKVLYGHLLSLAVQ